MILTLNVKIWANIVFFSATYHKIKLENGHLELFLLKM